MKSSGSHIGKPIRNLWTLAIRSDKNNLGDEATTGFGQKPREIKKLKGLCELGWRDRLRVEEVSLEEMSRFWDFTRNFSKYFSPSYFDKTYR